MFRAVKPRSDLSPISPEPYDISRAYGPASALAAVTNHAAIVVACAVAALLLAVVFDVTVTPRYLATTEILISPSDLRVLDKSVTTSPAQSLDAAVMQVESQTRVLTSDKVYRRVIEGERLTEDPEFMKVAGGLAPLLATIKAALRADSAGEREAGPELTVLRALQRRVYARRTERTYVIDVTVDTADPFKSARLANAIARSYVEEQADAQMEAARRVAKSLTSSLDEQRERVRKAEEAVEHFKAENNIVGSTGRLVHEQQLTDLNNQLTAAKVRTAEARTRLEQSVEAQHGKIDASATSEAVQSNTIGRLREQYAMAMRQASLLSAELGPRHPAVNEARAQLRDAERLIKDEIDRIASANRNDYERALANEKVLNRTVESLKQAAIRTNIAFVKLRELEREAEASRAVYESFLVRAREAREQERVDSVNVRVLSLAEPPASPVWPPRRLILLPGAIAAGFGAGVCLALLFDTAARRRRERGAEI